MFFFLCRFTGMAGISELFSGCPAHKLEGDAIHVLAEKGNQAFGESKLRISRCYEIQNYTCSNTETYRKMLKKQIHINVGRASKIEESTDVIDIPKEWYHPATIEELYNLLASPDYFPGFFKSYEREKKTKAID